MDPTSREYHLMRELTCFFCGIMAGLLLSIGIYALTCG